MLLNADGPHLRAIRIRCPDGPAGIRYALCMNDITELPPRAITLKPWWAWAIAHAGKRIENRSWPTRYRGPLAIHAGCARFTTAERLSFAQRLAAGGREHPDESAIDRSAIVAIAVLVDCVQLPSDQLGAWGAPNSWHWLLEDVRPLAQPIPMSGKLGIWRLLAGH